MWELIFAEYMISRVYLKSQVAQNDRLPYAKVGHNWLKVAPKYRLLAFQVTMIGTWTLLVQKMADGKSPSERREVSSGAFSSALKWRFGALGV